MLCGSSLNFLNFIESNKRACIISTQSEKHTEWNISSEHCPTPRTRIGMFPGPNTHVPFPAPPPHRWDDHLPDSCVFSLWAGATKCMLPCVPASARHWLCEILPWRCMGWIAYSLPDSFCCFFPWQWCGPWGLLGTGMGMWSSRQPVNTTGACM